MGRRKKKTWIRYSPEYKLKAIKLTEKKGATIWDVSQGLGISSSVLNKWIKKYETGGYKELINKAGGNRYVKAQPVAVVNKVLEVKRENPGMGTEKIRGHLLRFSLLDVCNSAIKKIFKQNPVEPTEEPARNQGIPTEAYIGEREIRPRKKARKKVSKKNKPKQIRYFERSSPNVLWQMDIMTFMLKGMYRIYLIGIIDDYSRYIVSHGLYRRQTEGNVHEVLRNGIEKHGCPKEILTDNGRQFYSWRGKSKFTKYCTKMGIQHIRSRPYHPQTLGKIESFWRNLYQEFLGEVPLSSFEEAQEKIAKWIKYYNQERVHLGIGGHLVPADRYFSISNQVEKLMEEGSKENEKALAKNPLSLKPPMYLVGKLGDKEIRLLAKDGEVTINEGEEKAVEGVVKNIVESTGEYIDKTEDKIETEVTEKTSLDGEQGVAESFPVSEEGLKSEAVTIFEKGAGDGRREEPGNAGNNGEPGGQIPPADKQPGEIGVDTVSIEEGKDSTGDMQGVEHQQGSVLQMDEGSDGSDEGSAGASGARTESEGGSCGEGGERAIEKEEQEIREGEVETANAGRSSEVYDRMAEEG